MHNKLLAAVSYGALFVGATVAPMSLNAAVFTNAPVQMVATQTAEYQQQRQELQEKAKELEGKLPNAVEKTTQESTSYLKEGFKWLGKGPGYVLKGVGSALGWGGKKIAEGANEAGSHLGVPGEIAGQAVSLPFQLVGNAAEKGLGITARTLETITGIVGDALGETVNAGATLTRSSSEAWRNLAGASVKNVGVATGATAESVGDIGSMILGDPANWVGDTVGAAAFASGHAADASIRGQDQYMLAPLNKQEEGRLLSVLPTTEKIMQNVNLDMPSIQKAFASGSADEVEQVLKTTIKEKGASMLATLNNQIKETAGYTKELASSRNAGAKEAAVKDTQKKLDDVNAQMKGLDEKYPIPAAIVAANARASK